MFGYLLVAVLGLGLGWAARANKRQISRFFGKATSDRSLEKGSHTLSSVWRNFRPYIIVVLVFACIICMIVGFLSFINTPSDQVVSVGDYVEVLDKCGNMFTIQLTRTHVEQGFILVSPQTECALDVPIGLKDQDQ